MFRFHGLRPYSTYINHLHCRHQSKSTQLLSRFRRSCSCSRPRSWRSAFLSHPALPTRPAFTLRLSYTSQPSLPLSLRIICILWYNYFKRRVLRIDPVSASNALRAPREKYVANVFSLNGKPLNYFRTLFTSCRQELLEALDTYACSHLLNQNGFVGTL